jgi:hypothetical protein
VESSVILRRGVDIVLSKGVYSWIMKITFILLNVVFSIFFSLVDPILPSVSFAKAKICCKINCEIIMEASPQAKSKTGAKSSSTQCKNYSCLIADKKFESLSVVVEYNRMKLRFSCCLP